VTEVELRCATDEAALARSAAAVVIAALGRALALRGRARWVLAGGSTPQRLYRLLADRPSAVDWSKVDFFWSDERLVPPSSPASNYGVTREALLDPLGIDPLRCHRVEGESAPRRAAKRYQEEVANALATGGWDLLLLGLGADGHTASLFPPRREGEDDDGRWVALTRAPSPPVERLTLTLSALSRARSVLFLVSGARKASAVSRALAGDPTLHAASVTASGGPVVWCLDEPAAVASTTIESSGSP